jgi:hypothetical protein
MSGMPLFNLGGSGFRVPNPDTGALEPITAHLNIQAGRDFEICARKHTIFHYHPMNPSYERHEEFWHGRRFQILLVKGGTTWVQGKVMAWEEYNMGPADAIMKWRLCADLDAADEIAPGVLVKPRKVTLGCTVYALVTAVQADRDTCTIELVEQEQDLNLYGINISADGTVKLSDWVPVRLCDQSLDIHRLNVQGGPLGGDLVGMDGALSGRILLFASPEANR